LKIDKRALVRAEADAAAAGRHRDALIGHASSSAMVALMPCARNTIEYGGDTWVGCD